MTEHVALFVNNRYSDKAKQLIVNNDMHQEELLKELWEAKADNVNVVIIHNYHVSLDMFKVYRNLADFLSVDFFSCRHPREIYYGINGHDLTSTEIKKGEPLHKLLTSLLPNIEGNDEGPSAPSNNIISFQISNDRDTVAVVTNNGATTYQLDHDTMQWAKLTVTQ